MDNIISLVAQYTKQRYEDDFVDRLNFLYTSYIFAFSALVIGYNTYFGTAITCWTPAEFRRGWGEYARDYCLIENTYYLPLEDPNMPSEVTRDQRELPYYQWVQFILVFLAFLFYIPYLIWHSISWWSGLQVHSVVSAAATLDKINEKNRSASIEKIAKHLEKFLNRHNTRSTIPFVPNFIGRSWVAYSYIFTKFLFVVNLFLQLVLIHVFLGFSWGDFFALRIGFGSNWIANGIFPRQTMCDFEVRNKGSIQKYSIQCVLSMNMLNEKIFLALFYWLIVLLFITTYNLIVTASNILRRPNRHELASRMLSAGGHIQLGIDHDSEKVPLVERPENLTTDFERYLPLTPDLATVFHLIAKNAGDNVCSDVMISLFKKLDQKSQ